MSFKMKVNICLACECDNIFYVYNESNVILINLEMLLNGKTNVVY